mgnify:CR=1 FL=1
MWIFSSLFLYSLLAMSVTPAKYELLLSTGERNTIYFTVKNDKLEMMKVRVNSKYWFVLPENKGIEIDSWLSFSPKEFYLKKGEGKRVICEVIVPKNASGFLNGMLSFNQIDSPTSVNITISVPVYIIIKDNYSFDFEVRGLKRENEYLLVEIFNKGNVYFRPRGRIKMNRERNFLIFKKKSFLFEKRFKEERPIFPGSSGYVKLGNLGLKDGKYEVILELEFWGDKKIRKKIVVLK